MNKRKIIIHNKSREVINIERDRNMNKRLNSKQRNYIIAGLCMILVIMGVGYAAFATQLKINGTANIDSNFSVKITNIQSTVQSGSASDAQPPSYTDTTATFKTNLVSPGDSMKYDITVSNEGSIDAVLESIEVNTGENEAITFETSGIENGDKLEASQTDILTIIVSYNSSVTSQPENTNSTITVTLNYKQDDGTVVPPTPTNPTIGGQEVELVESGDGLYADEYENGKYTYKGANPNNYITFNDEMWRIISVENDGTIKIMRNESIGNQIWHSENINDWETSDIKTYLNGEYLSSITTNQDKIVSHTWSIGAVTYDNSDLAGQIADENNTQSQSASIGMITASEYLRANTNKEQCENMNINNTNITTCKTTNWMFSIVPSNDYLWTISPRASYGTGVFCVVGDSSSAGRLVSHNAINSVGVSPALYLSSDITLSGTGESSNPYVIS